MKKKCYVCKRKVRKDHKWMRDHNGKKQVACRSCADRR